MVPYMYSTGSFWEKNYSTRSYMYSTGSFWRKNYSTRSYCVYIIEMQRPSPAARRHLFWTSLSLSTTVLLVPLARRIFALLFYGSRRSPGAGPTGPRGQDAPGRTPPTTTTTNNKVACISCLVNTGLLAGAHPRCCPASCLLVAVRCSSAACSALSAYRWWEQQISGCILLGASGSSILQGCLRVSNKNRQPNHAAGSSNKLHVQKYGSASPHLT